MLPLFLVCLLMVVEAGLVVRDALALQHVVRVAARDVSVHADEEHARHAAREVSGSLDAERIDFDVEPDPGVSAKRELVTVSAGYLVSVRIPVLGRFIGLDLPLRAELRVRLERDPP